jgi:nucleotide-binding universal stress UspA family protein
MFKGIKTILFATNLTQDCMKAFDFAVLLALKFQAKIVILHVLEKIPDYVESRLKGLLGSNTWEEIQQVHVDEVQQTLIGKRSSGKLIRKALEHFCTEAGIDDDSCGYQSQEIVIGDGNIVDSIIEHSKEHDCDLIILGGNESHLLKKSIGTTIKSVLRRSKKPVLIAPADPDAKSYLLENSGLRK